MGMEYSYGYRKSKKGYYLGKDEVRCWMCENYKSGVCVKFTLDISDKTMAEVCNSFKKRAKIKSKVSKKITVQKGKSKKAVSKYYAIKQGKKVSNLIVTDWPTCKKHTDGCFSVFKSFLTLEEAKKYLKSK